jgi:2-dehydro-3-deoxyglucarate aldolase/4-hydroxy-2-oxoheptanedioate aldolase
MNNQVKDSLAKGGFVYGTWVLAWRGPAIARMIAAAGFDFVFIDTEHSSLSWESVADLCEMSRASGVVPIVRPYDNAGPLVNRILDMGAMGILCADVTTRRVVDEMLQFMMYPPQGHRGSTSAAPPMDYLRGPGQQVKQHVNANVLMAIQIESRAGVEHVHEILAPGGVDLVEIGRSDLSSSYGVPMEVRHPIVLSAVDTIVEACRAHGVAVGANSSSPEDAADLVARGITCLSYSTDRHIILDAYTRAVAEFNTITGRAN